MKSDSKPISFLDMSLAIIQSQFFSDIFFKELFLREFVSAAKPITNFGLSELWFEICPKISVFFSKESSESLSFFIFSFSLFFILKSATAA